MGLGATWWPTFSKRRRGYVDHLETAQVFFRCRIGRPIKEGGQTPLHMADIIPAVYWDRVLISSCRAASADATG